MESEKIADNLIAQVHGMSCSFIALGVFAFISIAMSIFLKKEKKENEMKILSEN